MRLDGQCAIVTGGASGIGRATADLLAFSGARVCIGDIDVKGGEAVAAKIRAGGGSAESHRLDITDAKSIETFAGAHLESEERIDILVNAAGWEQRKPFVDSSAAFAEEVVRLNLLGPIGVTRAFLPAMLKARSGKIVNVASDAARVGNGAEVVYSGAKGGVISFTRALAAEVADHGVHVNCVCPGPTDTPLFASMPESIRDALLRAMPFRRLARPEDVANSILFFASPMSNFVTGEILSVRGGPSARS